ncbi:MarR family transcriptional regulator [Halolamina salifodinae]|uniref:Putative transcriptional regulator n=1 Tax=Halolamina salifodinae TaxID=1202767 RepID=A0A8T4GSV7_9EURY|nr:MarR family transcriptional regulator [Halolamina salifodinae]MBP1985959.1 putative transcriptional regulator [Halolamina salifodinae]
MGDESREEMVERVSSFSPVDYEILQFFEEHDILASPKVVAVNIDYDRQYVSKRLGELRDLDLLRKDESGLYELTDYARSFLDGEVDPEKLEE